jgi:hypothetical protein
VKQSDGGNLRRGSKSDAAASTMLEAVKALTQDQQGYADQDIVNLIKLANLDEVAAAAAVTATPSTSQ